MDQDKLSLKSKVIIAVVGLLLGAAVALFVFSDPRSSKVVDETVKDIIEETKTFESEVKEDERRTIYETRIIRERVAEEADALPPDELASGILYELELFRRGTSTDNLAGSTSRVDS